MNTLNHRRYHWLFAIIIALASSATGAGDIPDIVRLAQGGKLEEVRALLDAGTDIETSDPRGRTPLIAAAMNGHLDLVKLLLERGANINAYADYYGTAVFIAYGQIHMTTVAYLIERGADVNIAKEEGHTLLMSAGLFGDAERVRLLLGAGANKNLKNSKGQTALAIAKKSFAEKKKLGDMDKALEARFAETLKLLGDKAAPNYVTVGKVFKREGKNVEIIGQDALKIRIGTGLIIRTKKGDVPAVVRENYHTKSKCIVPFGANQVNAGDPVLSR